MRIVSGSNCVRCFAVATLLLGVPTWGWAVDLPPGGEVALQGTTTFQRPELAGPVVLDILIPFTISDAAGNPIYRGNVQNRVSFSDIDQTYIFCLRIRDTDPTLPGRLALVTRTGFHRGTTDVDYALDGLGMIGPAAASRTLHRHGNEVDFDFSNNPIPGGSSSYFVFVLTGATDYKDGKGTLTLYTTDGSSVSVAVAAPRNR